MSTKRLMAWLVIVVFGTVAFGAEEGHDAQVDELIAGLVESAGVKPRRCGWGAYLGLTLPVATCGKIPRKVRKDAEGLRATIDAYFERAGVLPRQVQGDDGWRLDDPRAYRDFTAGEIPIRVSLDFKVGHVILRYPSQLQPCMDLRITVEPNTGTKPKLVSRVEPEFPLKARRKGVPGRVQVIAMIRADGTVGDLCVQYVDPPGLGFEEAALEAIRQWTYAPAMVDGEPVDSLFTVMTAWNVR